MTTTINASTSSGLVVTPDNSGNVMLQYNGTSTPVFFAYMANTQTITAATNTKVNLDTKLFDTASWFNTSTNRYTPLVAGYYQVSFGLYGNVDTSTPSIRAYLYKNGTYYVSGSWIYNPSSQSDDVSTGSGLVYLNGSTDYIELYAYIQGGTNPKIYGGAATYWTFMSGALIRGA
jgi:hypothetical protein